MNKRKALKMLTEYGDAILEFNNYAPSVCCTIDFSNKYIRSIRRTKRFDLKGNILVFNWTSNEFDAIDVNTIKTITPLSKLLDNKNGQENN